MSMEQAMQVLMHRHMQTHQAEVIYNYVFLIYVRYVIYQSQNSKQAIHLPNVVYNNLPINNDKFDSFIK